MTSTKKPAAARRTGAEVDAALAAAAQGVAPTSDDAAAQFDDEGRRETDVIGNPAGVAISDGKSLGGPDEIDRRDARRWELDPASAEDFVARKKAPVAGSPTGRVHVHARPPSGER